MVGGTEHLRRFLPRPKSPIRPHTNVVWEVCSVFVYCVSHRYVIYDRAPIRIDAASPSCACAAAVMAGRTKALALLSRKAMLDNKPESAHVRRWLRGLRWPSAPPPSSGACLLVRACACVPLAAGAPEEMWRLALMQHGRGTPPHTSATTPLSTRAAIL